MAQSLIPTPEKMNMKGDLVSNWEYFKDSWNNYATATELGKKSEEIVVATLLSVMGKECHLGPVVQSPISASPGLTL